MNQNYSNDGNLSKKLDKLQTTVNYLLSVISGGSVIATSEDGTKWRIIVSDGGVLATEEVE